jgi:hypothetical protein
MRYRRITTGIFNDALRIGLSRILSRIKFPENNGVFGLDPKLGEENRQGSARLAHHWFANDPESKRLVSCLLEEAGLDETAIEAKAFAIAADELERANQLSDVANREFERAYHSLAKYRKKLAVHVQRNVNRVLAADDVPSIVNVPVN